jgi:hypothetical protein
MASGKTTSYVETFDIGPSVVTVDEAVARLRASGIVTTADDLDQLQWYCFVASDTVADDLGRVILPRTVTETRNGGKDRLNLLSTPVISVTSVTESGTLLTASDWVVDKVTGTLYRGSTTSGFNFAWGRQNLTIVYLAGFYNPPRYVREVALSVVQGLWQASQQASHPLLDEAALAAGLIGPAVAGLPEPMRNAYKSLQAVGIA